MMRTYLVVIDESAEAKVALRFAARRAARTGGGVLLLALVPRQEFAPWGGVQQAMEEEAKLRAEAMVAAAAGELVEEMGVRPVILVREGDTVPVIRAVMTEHPEVAALVLGAAASGGPGPTVAHFTAEAGTLPCPLMIVPGGLSEEELDRLS